MFAAPIFAAMNGSGSWSSPPLCSRRVTPSREMSLPSAQMRPMPVIGPSQSATAKRGEVEVLGDLGAAASAAALAAPPWWVVRVSSRKSVAQMMLPPVRIAP